MKQISQQLCRWYEQEKRDLPWRHTHDAYHIFLSEIILQQTRVAQGLPYYERFVEAYPTVEALATATEDEVLKHWQGLGYYSRARHLHQAARQVMERHQGIFPTDYDTLRGLSGIGPYTAAAIASFSSDERVAVIDGNVNRVIARLLDIADPIDSRQGILRIQEAATLLLADATSARTHNQAIMELGALCCTPTSPHCTACPIADHCLALENATIGQRPVKQGRIQVRERKLSYVIYKSGDMLWVHQRPAGDIWQGLWEYVPHSPMQAGEGLTLEPIRLQCRHVLTHQRLLCDFWLCDLTEAQDTAIAPSLQAEGYRQMRWEEWQGLAVPRLIEQINMIISARFDNGLPDT